jgi:hypothetical protein
MAFCTTWRMSGKFGSPLSNLPSDCSGSGGLGSNDRLVRASVGSPASDTNAGSTCCGMLVDTLWVVAEAMALRRHAHWTPQRLGRPSTGEERANVVPERRPGLARRELLLAVGQHEWADLLNPVA